MGQLSLLQLRAGNVPSFCKRSQSHGGRLKMLTALGLHTWLQQRQWPLFLTQGCFILFYFLVFTRVLPSQKKKKKKFSAVRVCSLTFWHLIYFFFIGKTPFRKKKISPLFILASYGWQLQEAVGWRTAAEPAAKPHQLAFDPAPHRARLERGQPGRTGGSSSEHPSRNKKWNRLWVVLCFF